MTTARKDPGDAGVYAAVRVSIERCSAWLCENSPPPALPPSFTSEQRDLFIKQYRSDPFTIVNFGVPLDEEPGSRCGLVRRLLRESLAANVLDERRRRHAELRGQPNAAFYDDSRTRDALTLLERHGPQVQKAAQLLVEEVESREKAIAVYRDNSVVLSDFDRTLREQARAVVLALDTLVGHLPTVHEVVPPRTLKNFNAFRAEWSKRLSDASFKNGEIQNLLGYERSSDPDIRTRNRDRIRKASKRAR